MPVFSTEEVPPRPGFLIDREDGSGDRSWFTSFSGKTCISLVRMVTGKDGDHTGTRRMVTGQVTTAVLPDLGQMQQWQAGLDSAGEGIWGLDLQGRCTFVNRMAGSTFGFASDEELVGGKM